jgi:nucleolin
MSFLLLLQALPKLTCLQAEESSDDSDSDEEDSDDSDDSSEEEKTEAAPSKKRKAEEEIDEAPKKAKAEAEDTPTTLFAGSLSWGVDDNILYEAFKQFDGLVGARVVTDKMTGKSRGFGYVDFSNAEAANKAHEAMQGAEIEGRAINLDHASSSRADSTPQSRANDRAKKHGDTVSPESDTLFVGNLPFEIDQESVREFFADVAEPTSVRLPTDQ